MGAKDQSLGVSNTSTPTFALNHCLFSSTKLINAIGVSQTSAAIKLNHYKTVPAGCQEFGIPAGRAADLLR